MFFLRLEGVPATPQEARLGAGDTYRFVDPHEVAAGGSTLHDGDAALPAHVECVESVRALLDISRYVADTHRLRSTGEAEAVAATEAESCVASRRWCDYICEPAARRATAR